MVCHIRISTARRAFSAQVVVCNEALMDAIVDCLKLFGFVTLDEVVGIEVLEERPLD